jgi:ureidoglycolate lyase
MDQGSTSDSLQATSFHAHNFDPGLQGVAEFVWVQYKWHGTAVTHLECHRLTEQAIIPITGAPIVQVVCPPPADPMATNLRPELDQMKAFLLDGSKGVCMKPGCWHWQFPLVERATYLVVTRRSTTVDLWQAKARGIVAAETVRIALSDLTNMLFEFVL